MNGLIPRWDSAQAVEVPKEYKPRTLREQLQDQKAGMAKRIEEIDEAIALLDRNPDFEKLQNLLSR